MTGWVKSPIPSNSGAPARFTSSSFGSSSVSLETFVAVHPTANMIEVRNKVLKNQSSYQEVMSVQTSKALVYLLSGMSLLVFIILFLPWTQNIRAKGKLTTLKPQDREQKIHSVISGRIEEWFVSEGVSYQGHENKIAAFNEIIQALSIEPEQAAHVGDDVLDLPVMTRVGLAIAVNDANFAVRDYADWCTDMPGGLGAVREVCDFIMQAQGTFDSVLKSYMQ